MAVNRPETRAEGQEETGDDSKIFVNPPGKWTEPGVECINSCKSNLEGEERSGKHLEVRALVLPHVPCATIECYDCCYIILFGVVAIMQVALAIASFTAVRILDVPALVGSRISNSTLRFSRFSEIRLDLYHDSSMFLGI